jgi:hypothetical protein
MVDDPSLSCSLHRLGTRGALSIVATGTVGLMIPALFLALLLKHSVAVRTDLALHQTGRGRSTPAGNPYHFVRHHLSSLYATMTARRSVFATTHSCSIQMYRTR